MTVLLILVIAILMFCVIGIVGLAAFDLAVGVWWCFGDIICIILIILLIKKIIKTIKNKKRDKKEDN